MGTLSLAGAPPRPPIRLFVSGAAGDDSPRTVSTFFDEYFLPLSLEANGAAANTIASYNESIEWWIKLTGDPDLRSVDAFTIAQFKTGLLVAKYRRGPLGTDQPLAPYTQGKHVRQIRAVLALAGTTPDPDEPETMLLPRVPALSIRKPSLTLPREHFPLEAARLMVAYVPDLPEPRSLSKWRAPYSLFWRCLLLALFYTGLRIGTILKLRWQMIEVRDKAVWFRVPGSIVEKTGKPIVKFVHPVLGAALAELRRYATSETELIFNWPYRQRHIANRHALLQSLAGIPATKQLTPHAWRRTHATEMARLGAKHAQEAARRSLDHADQRTTSEFYCNIEAELIAQLPDIGGRPGDSRQRNLF